LKLRNAWILFVVLAVAACGGAAEEPVADTGAAAAADAAPMDDGAALDELTEYFVTHYNMHHAGMVAELYADDAVFLATDGSVREGKAAIEAAMEEGMAAQPTLALNVDDRIITGDAAVSRGTWAVEQTPEGADAPVTLDGHYLTVQAKIDGEWKTTVVITNYDEAPPEGTPYNETVGEAPPELTDSPLSELVAYYATHWNMGHGDMVASRYAEDAVAAFADMPQASGREAIAAQMNERIEGGNTPQLTIHEVAAEDIGGGYYIGGGWYEMVADAGNSVGAYIMLVRAGDDGTMQIQWAVSNAQPAMQ